MRAFGRASRPACAQRRGHEPARVEQAHDVAVLLDAVLVAHRAPDAFGRLPVDLAHVVVGEVVAHRLELGAEPERAARAQPGIAEAAAAQRDHEPLRGEHVGVHEEVGAAVGVERARAEAERPAPAGGDRRKPVRAAPVRDDASRRAGPRPVARLDREVGRLRLAQLDARASRRRSSRSRAPRARRARARSGCCAARAAGGARAPCRPRSRTTTSDARARSRSRPATASAASPTIDERDRGPRRRAHAAHRGHGDGGDRGRDRVVGGVALELGLGPELQPVAQHRGRDGDDVVGRHEVTAREPRRRLRRREQVHRAARARAERHARELARPAHERDDVADDRVAHGRRVDRRARLDELGRRRDRLHVGRASPARRRRARGAGSRPRRRRSGSRRRSWRGSGRAALRGAG